MRKPHAKATIVCLPLERCYAKTSVEADGSIRLGCTVYQHCLLTGIVGEALVDAYPAWFTKNAHRLFPSHAGLLCALHDIGKIYPRFQEKLRKAAHSDMEGLPDEGMDADAAAGYHYSVTFDTFAHDDYALAFVLGRHHGRKPRMPARNADAEILGGDGWYSVRKECIRRLENDFHCSVSDIRIPDRDIASGLITFADWISSSAQLSSVDYSNLEVLRQKARELISAIGIRLPHIPPKMSFAQIFRFPPRPLQQVFVNQVRPGGVYILEAPMGVGKTEASLYCTYLLLSEDHATGLYYALPTRVTADQIYQRVNRFLDVLLGEYHARLIHGQSSFDVEQEDVAPGGSWFSSAKRAILAPCGVGTIDQALMSIINVKHNYLRAFGLAGKVLIIDEVHSYDAYTSELIRTLVHRVTELGCTVLILSATLTTELEQQLLASAQKDENGTVPYPSLVKADQGKVIHVPLPYPVKPYLVNVRQESDEDAYGEAIDAALQGEQVLWVENTINEAQEAFRILSARTEGRAETGLLHSAFTPKDRTQIEQRWIGLFGKEGLEKRKAKGRILVGTQILEQSLDIDADRLFTRFCPTDLLIQRCGRLFRHSETDSYRPRSARRQAILLPSVARKNSEFGFIGKSQYVYDNYVLCRSYEALEGKKSIKFPDEIPSLIAQTYKDMPEESPQMQSLKSELERNKEKLRTAANAALAADSSPVSSDDTATTRLNERPKGSLLLVRNITYLADGAKLVLWDGTACDVMETDEASHRKQIAKALMDNMVSLDISEKKCGRLTRFVSHYVYAGIKTDGTASLHIAIVRNRKVEDEEGNLFGYYDSRIGFVRKKEHDGK